MNGKHHFSFSLYALLILFAAIWHCLHYPLISLERCGFWFLVVTIYTNPDADTPSKPSNNLGIFKYIFLPLEHRGISHNPFAWALLGMAFGHFGYVPEGIGLFAAAVSHIVPDKIVTGIKEIVPDPVKKICKFVYKQGKKVF